MGLTDRHHRSPTDGMSSLVLVALLLLLIAILRPGVCFLELEW